MNFLLIRPSVLNLCSSDGSCRRIADVAPDSLLTSIDAIRPDGLVFLGVTNPSPIGFLCELRSRSGFDHIKAAIIRSEQELRSLRNLTECGLKDAFVRFQSLFRRDESHKPQEGRKFIIDMRARELSVSGRVITCSPMEFRLLVFFLRYPGVIFSRQELLQRTSNNGQSVDSQIVDVLVRRIRMKIERDVRSPDLLRTARGLGYRLTINGDTFLDRITGRSFVSWPCLP